MSAELATAERVYAYHWDNVLLRGHAPTGAAVCHALHLSRRDYYAALRWLEAHRFVSIAPRRWRNVTVITRLCNDCGMELTPTNGVYVQSRGRTYRRNECADCLRTKDTARKQAWRASNPNYAARLMKRTRQQRSITP